MTCKNLIWDQRMSNEPIYKRNIFPDQPPILFTQRPMNTNQYYTDDNINRNNNWLITDNNTNKKLNNYMKDYDNSFENNKNYNKIGIWEDQFKNNNSNNLNHIYGIKYDINKESKLKSMNYQNSKDCISPNVMKKLSKLNKSSDLQIYNDSFIICNVYPNYTNKWFNNQVKMKLRTDIPVTGEYRSPMLSKSKSKKPINCDKCLKF